MREQRDSGGGERVVVPSPTLARRFWEAIEPVHAVAYFTPEPAEAARAVGLLGWWMGYFAGRLAPLGPLGAPAAKALCFAFAPGRVARALPDAWTYATPEKVLHTRMGAVQAALERVLPATGHADLERLVHLLERAVAGCGYEGRPLAAAWSGVPRPGSLTGRLWLAATILREHRGDGHVIAAAHAGLTGIEAGLTHVATGQIPRALIQTSRGWSDADWEQARRRLVARGLLDQGSRLSKRGGVVRREIENATDRLAAAPVTLLGPSGVEEAIRLAAPLSRHLVDTGVVPVPNPIGAPRP
ncbi:SCO6745 family protein [Streptosporangium sp. CA-135522]|uniref:SCO6745 family protein n=1 Tax=Streptosporangium sp. CA-135522 TaxID=3240072 RepID=UPI003D8BB56C